MQSEGIIVPSGSDGAVNVSVVVELSAFIVVPLYIGSIVEVQNNRLLNNKPYATFNLY